jgi:hypothetical protein
MDPELTEDLEAAPPPRWTRQRLIALAVAVLFVGAVAGIAFAATGGGGPAPLPKLPVGASSSEQATASTGAVAPGLAPFGVVRYELRGALPALAGSAPAYRLGDAFNQGAAGRLAAALGLHGTLRAGGQGWILTDGDRTLSISNAPGLPWWLEPGAVAGGVVGVTRTGVATAGSATAAPLPTTVPPPGTPPPAACPMPVCPPNALCAQLCGPPTPPRTADLPTTAAAERLARSTAAAAGLAVSDADATVTEGSTVAVALAPRLGGVPTSGWSWTFDLGSRGAIQDASGFLAPASRIGNYPLAGTATGFVRLQQGIGVGPRTMLGVAEPDLAYPACAPVSGCPAPQTVTVTGVHLALANEGGYLVPTYVFTNAAGQSVGAVPAATDAELQPPAAVPGVPTTVVLPKGVPVPQTAPATLPTPATQPAPAIQTAPSSPCGPQPPPGSAAPNSCKG